MVIKQVSIRLLSRRFRLKIGKHEKLLILLSIFTVRYATPRNSLLLQNGNFAPHLHISAEVTHIARRLFQQLSATFLPSKCQQFPAYEYA